MTTLADELMGLIPAPVAKGRPSRIERPMITERKAKRRRNDAARLERKRLRVEAAARAESAAAARLASLAAEFAAMQRRFEEGRPLKARRQLQDRIDRIKP
jgi:hypothetical protein